MLTTRGHIDLLRVASAVCRRGGGRFCRWGRHRWRWCSGVVEALLALRPWLWPWPVCWCRSL